jgi:hypothetical protein
MSFRCRTPIVLAAVMAMTFTTSGIAWAGGKHHYDRHGNGHHQKHHHHHKRHHNSGHNYRRYDSDDDEKLLIGLLLGGVFGYAISNASQSYAPEPPPYPAASSYPTPTYNSGNSASTCLQEREYQMKVMVGGKAADAYGTACLQPDGSWYRGPAHLVSH